MVSTGSVDRNVLTSSYHERVPSKHAKRGLKDLQQQPQQPYLPHHDHSGLAAAAAAGGPHLHLARKRSKLAGSATSSSLSSMASSQLGRPGQASASFNRGLFVAFIDNAFAERKRGRNEHYNELVAQFKAFSSSSNSAAAPSSSSSQHARANVSHQETAATSGQLRSWIEALTHVVAQLDRSHFTLVDAIVSLPWTAMADDIVYAYSRFVQALLCSRSEFVQMTLEKIVRGFRFQSGPLPAAGSSVTEPLQSPVVTRRQAYERLHILLSSLIHLIPTLPNALWPIVNRHFPHKRENRNAQVAYITNALRIVEYCPQLGENVLGAVILRAIQIDVEIQLDIEDLEDDEGVLDEEVFGFSLENPFDRLVGDDDSDSDSDDEGEDESLDVDAVSSDEGESTEEEGEQNETQRFGPNGSKIISPKTIKRLKEMAAKLDAILRVVFDFLHRLSTTSRQRPSLSASSSLESPGLLLLGRDDLQIGNEAFSMGNSSGPPTTRMTYETGAILRQTIFEVLLCIFDEKILRTFQTRHTQFVLFWFASLSPEFTDHFTGNLIGRTLDEKDTPTITRVAAAGYVASFVSRALSIDRGGARKVVALLCAYLDDEMEILRSSSSRTFVPAGKNGLDDRVVRTSVVFYAICQAIFYIFCFRWRDLLDDDDEDLETLEGLGAAHRWMPELDTLKQAITSTLNPLKLCAPNVVSQFARVAHKTDFMYCHSIIEANKRQTRSRRNMMVESPPSDSSPLPTPVAARPTSLPRSSSSNSGALQTQLVEQTLRDAQIDSHFPFDPYKLPLSSTFIHGIYRNWDSGGLADDDEDEDEEGDVDDSDVDASTATETEAEEDSSIASSSLGSAADAVAQKYLLSANGSMPIKGISTTLVSGNSLSGDEDILQDSDFSKSFEAMSVSPRRSGGTTSAAYALQF